jgi:uncharacterized Zn finger protein
MQIQCPACGEQERERLKPHRRSDSIRITCLSCGHEWQRGPDRCDSCGGRTVPRREPLMQGARGTQQSIIGFRIVRECSRCGASTEASSA